MKPEDTPLEDPTEIAPPNEMDEGLLGDGDETDEIESLATEHRPTPFYLYPVSCAQCGKGKNIRCLGLSQDKNGEVHVVLLCECCGGVSFLRCSAYVDQPEIKTEKGDSGIQPGYCG